jgi:opacity protein-like surface antigen
MKKLLIISGLLAAGEVCAELTTPAALTVQSKVEFNTASVSNGRHTMGNNIVPSFEIGTPLFNGSGRLYFSVEGTFKTKSVDEKGGNDVLSTIGFSYDVTDLLTIDVGYDWDYDIEGDTKISKVNGKKFALVQDGKAKDRLVPDGQGGTKQEAEGSVNAKRSFHEVYAGVMANMLLKPGLYLKYDITQRRIKAEGTMGHTFDWGSSGFAVELGAKLGYVNIRKPNGVNAEVMFVEEVAAGETRIDNHVSDLYDKKDWYYFSANANLTYNFNEHAKVYTGVAAIWNNAPKDCWVNSTYGKKHKVWFTVGSEFSF